MTKMAGFVEGFRLKRLNAVKNVNLVETAINKTNKKGSQRIITL